MSHRHPNPFHTDPHPDLSRTIAEIVAPKTEREKVVAPKTEKGKGLPDKWGGREPYVKKDPGTARKYAAHGAPVKESGTVGEACWRGYTARGLKRKGERMVPDCVKEEPKPRTAAEWSAANRGSRETAKALQRGMERFRKRTAELASREGKQKQSPAQPVREGATPCERAALARLKSANAEDLKEKPGAAGEKAHKRLHTTIGSILKKK